MNTMQIIGRDYQLKHADKVVEEVSTFRKVLAQLPTGGGKTVEFCLIIKRFLAKEKYKSALILVHRQELMYQAKKTIKDILGIDAYLITRDTKKHKFASVYIGMVDSTLQRLDFTNDIGLVIIDECHVANFNKVHSSFLEELIIGYTATPISSSKKEPLNKYYSRIITGPQINELIEMGYLAQNVTRCPKDIVDASKFSYNVMKGDYDEGSMFKEFSQTKHLTSVIDNYFKFCDGKKTIVFNVNVEHSKEVNRYFQRCGYNSRHLDADSPDREEILKWFKETEDAILCNVMIATVGFDEPTIHNVILNFSTTSLVKFIQCSGRGGRIIDEMFIYNKQKEYKYDLDIKTHFNIIDMGGNAVRFGDWSDDRDWEYLFNFPDEPKEGVAPVKICPACEAMVHAAARVCPFKNENNELCLYEFEKKVEVKEEKEQDLVIFTKNIDIDKLIEKSKSKYDYYLFHKLGEEVVSELFEKSEKPSQTLIIRAFDEYFNLCVRWWKTEQANKNGNIPDISDSSFHINKAKYWFLKLVKSRQPEFEF